MATTGIGVQDTLKAITKLVLLSVLIHLLLQWYSLSDPAMDDALIEVPTMRRFAGIELISDRIPDRPRS